MMKKINKTKQWNTSIIIRPLIFFTLYSLLFTLTSQTSFALLCSRGKLSTHALNLTSFPQTFLRSFASFNRPYYFFTQGNFDETLIRLTGKTVNRWKKNAQFSKMLQLRETDADLKNLSENEMLSIYLYTQSFHTQINQFARAKALSDEQIDQPNLTGSEELEGMNLFLFTLNSALKKLPAYRNNQGRVFRATVRMPEILKGDPPKGLIFRTLDFISSTYDPKSMVIRSDTDDYVVVLESFSGRSIEHLSDVKEEKEILFPRNTFFEVADPPKDFDVKAFFPAKRGNVLFIREVPSIYNAELIHGLSVLELSL